MTNEYTQNPNTRCRTQARRQGQARLVAEKSEDPNPDALRQLRP